MELLGVTAKTVQHAIAKQTPRSSRPRQPNLSLIASDTNDIWL
jgi:hypothetical protein